MNVMDLETFSLNHVRGIIKDEEYKEFLLELCSNAEYILNNFSDRDSLKFYDCLTICRDRKSVV